MNSGKFLNQLSKAYRNILFEQEIPVPPSPEAAPESLGAPPMPPAPPAPAGPPADSTGDVEKDVTKEGPLSQESQTFLTNLLAKAFFIEITDGSERYQIKNMQNALGDEAKVPQVEFETVKKLESLDPQIIDVDEELFELTPEGSKMFIDEIIKRNLIPDLEVKPGGGRAYMLNLILTALLRPTDLNVVEISDLLEQIKEKTEQVKESKFAPLYAAALSKYAKL